MTNTIAQVTATSPACYLTVNADKTTAMLKVCYSYNDSNFDLMVQCNVTVSADKVTVKEFHTDDTKAKFYASNLADLCDTDGMERLAVEGVQNAQVSELIYAHVLINDSLVISYR